MSRLDAAEINHELDRLREAGWQEAHFEAWVRDTARDVAQRSLAGAGRREYLMGPAVLGDTRYRRPDSPIGRAFAQVSIEWPRLTIVGGEHDINHFALALEPAIRQIAMRELGAARAAAGIAGT